MSWAAVVLAALLSVAVLAAPVEGAPKRGKAQPPPPPPPPPPPTKGELLKQSAQAAVARVRSVALDVVVPRATATAAWGHKAALAATRSAGSAARVAFVAMRTSVRAAAPVLQRTWDRVGSVDVSALSKVATPGSVVLVLAVVAATVYMQRRGAASGVKVRYGCQPAAWATERQVTCLLENDVLSPGQALLRAMLAVSVANVLVPFAVVAATSVLEGAQLALTHPLAALSLALALNCVGHLPALLPAVRARLPKRKARAPALVIPADAATMRPRISSGELTPGKAVPGVAKPPTTPVNGAKKTSPGPVKK